MNKQTFKSSATSRFSCSSCFFSSHCYFWTDVQKIFYKLFTSVTKETCDQDRTYFTEDTRKSFHNQCDPRYTICFTSFMIASTGNIRIYKNDKWGKKMWRKIEDSIFWGSKDRQFELVIKKGWRKIKEKEFKITYLLIHNEKVILMLLMNNLSHQKI